MKRVLKFNTINGRMTGIIFFLILNFTIFSTYVLYENSAIKRLFYLHTSQNEPSITLTFIGAWQLSQSRGFVEDGVINLSDEKEKEYLDHCDGILNTSNLIKWHCDTLQIDEYKDHYPKIKKAWERYVNEGKHIFELIRLSKDQELYSKQYGNADIREILKKEVSTEFNDSYWRLFDSIFQGMNYYRDMKETRADELKARTVRIVKVISISLIISLIVSFFSWYKLSGYFSRSIKRIIYLIRRISEGELVKEEVNSEDEVAEIISATNKLVSNLDTASHFAAKIGKGDFNYAFSPAGDKDALGFALISMRDELEKFKKEDEKRYWINQGFAEFGEIFRNNNQNLQQLSDGFIASLVKYLKANQGTLFILNDNNNSDLFLELKSCYAYSKKKFMEAKILPGEGLIGQAFLEKDHIYITDVPENYIKITSGLGEATPRSILIMPLIDDDKCLGVVEIASFEEFQQFEIDFVKKIGEDLASMLYSVKNTEKMADLVAQLQLKSEAMSSQEEELRQNMEELLATQEGILRKESEYLQVIDNLKKELETVKKSTVY